MYERLYRSLYRIRRVEEEIARVYPTDKIKSPVHLSIGQEAVSVGVCEELAPQDVVFTEDALFIRLPDGREQKIDGLYRNFEVPAATPSLSLELPCPRFDFSGAGSTRLSSNSALRISSSRGVAGRGRVARANESQARGNAPTPPRTPRRCAASIGHIRPCRSV